MDEVADKTAAINMNGADDLKDGQEPSKNAQKKAAKQAKLAEEKANKSATNTTKETARAEAKKAVPKAAKKKIEGAALIGIDVAKEVDFPGWYQQVLTKGEFLDYYDVSGCYILRVWNNSSCLPVIAFANRFQPGSYFIWEEIQAWFNKKIKSIGVENVAFPLFVSQDVLEKEKAHIEGFAAEVAWVTHAGKTPLEKKIAIRPTSETVMYPYYAKWIQSYRDLPLRLNQWNSVVRWEFKHPQPFLRTREFHWQEGHTAHLTQEDASKEVRQILEWYAGVYEELLAIPVIRGLKTEKEKFAGADYTTTVEGYIPTTGRGIQGGTSHCLGQNFSKMFGIQVEDPSKKGGEKINVWQNSWGLSTRTIGVMVMTHSDNKGLVIPPRVAQRQVVIVPVGVTAKTTEEQKIALHKQIDALEEVLKASDIRVISDKRDGYSPGEKFNEWELKGVPLRLEFGPGESEGHYVTSARRDQRTEDGKAVKEKIAITELGPEVEKLLANIQRSLYETAEKAFKSHTITVTEWKDFVPALNAKNVVLIPHCLTEECEDEIKDLSARKEEGDDTPQDEKAPSMGAKSLCIPYEQPKEGLAEGTMCTNPKCKRKAEKWCLFGRSY